MREITVHPKDDGTVVVIDDAGGIFASSDERTHLIDEIESVDGVSCLINFDERGAYTFQLEPFEASTSTRIIEAIKRELDRQINMRCKRDCRVVVKSPRH